MKNKKVEKKYAVIIILGVIILFGILGYLIFCNKSSKNEINTTTKKTTTTMVTSNVSTNTTSSGTTTTKRNYNEVVTTTRVNNKSDNILDYKDLCGNKELCSATKEFSLNGKNHKLTLSLTSKDEFGEGNYLMFDDVKIKFESKKLLKIGIMDGGYIAIAYNESPMDGSGVILLDSNFKEIDYLKENNLTSVELSSTEINESDIILNSSTFVFATCVGYESETDGYHQEYTIYSVTLNSKGHYLNQIYQESTFCSAQR